jgi:hypothetical protein
MLWGYIIHVSTYGPEMLQQFKIMNRARRKILKFVFDNLNVNRICILETSYSHKYNNNNILVSH